MLNDLLRNVNLSADTQVLGVEDEMVNGRILKKQVVKTYSPKEMMSKYRVSDFYTENLIAVGADATCAPILPGRLADADHIAEVLENLEED